MTPADLPVFRADTTSGRPAKGQNQAREWQRESSVQQQAGLRVPVFLCLKHQRARTQTVVVFGGWIKLPWASLQDLVGALGSDSEIPFRVA